MAEAAAGASRSLIEDVFRRADKNDDGALSWEEFRYYFSDGCVQEDTLKKLFHEIDTKNTNNIDVAELAAFFGAHLGPFAAVFDAISKVDDAVKAALHESSESYHSADGEGVDAKQLMIRLFLRETQNHLEAAARPVEAASDFLSSAADSAVPQTPLSADAVVAAEQEAARVAQRSVSTDAPNTTGGPIVAGRVGRRMRRNQYQTQQSWPASQHSLMQQTWSMSSELPSEFASQIARFTQLLDRMEASLAPIRLGPETDNPGHGGVPASSAEGVQSVPGGGVSAEPPAAKVAGDDPAQPTAMTE